MSGSRCTWSSLEVRTWRWLGLAIDLPVPGSLDPAALVLTVGAVVAVFWLRIGIVPLLAIWALLGLAWWAVGGMG